MFQLSRTIRRTRLGLTVVVPMLCVLVMGTQAVFANQMGTTGDGMLRAQANNQSYGIQLQSFLGESGEAVRRDGTYDYGPSVIKVNDTTVRMWYCGGNTSSNTRGDSVWYSESTNYGQSGTWSTPVEVIRASNNWSYLDSSHACDPSVVRKGDNYYVFYTGAPDWRGRYGAGDGQACNGVGNNMGCDNRIFVARVPVWAAASKQSYQKAVNVGECVDWGCFQWRPFWSGTEYPPVAVVRYEDGPVWRIIGTGVTGYTDRQTKDYGTGQPSALNVNSALEVWHTDIRNGSSRVNVWQKDQYHAEWAWNIQTKLGQPGEKWEQIPSQVENDVNYDVAYSQEKNRYVATISRQVAANDADDKPRVHIARNQGTTLVSQTAPFIDRNIGGQPEAALAYAQRDAHNDGFMRDEYGYLAMMAGHPGGELFSWVYYSTSDNNIIVDSNINRTPFRLQ